MVYFNYGWSLRGLLPLSLESMLSASNKAGVYVATSSKVEEYVVYSIKAGVNMVFFQFRLESTLSTSIKVGVNMVYFN